MLFRFCTGRRNVGNDRLSQIAETETESYWKCTTDAKMSTVLFGIRYWNETGQQENGIGNMVMYWKHGVTETW